MHMAGSPDVKTEVFALGAETSEDGFKAQAQYGQPLGGVGALMQSGTLGPVDAPRNEQRHDNPSDMLCHRKHGFRPSVSAKSPDIGDTGPLLVEAIQRDGGAIPGIPREGMAQIGAGHDVAQEDFRPLVGSPDRVYLLAVDRPQIGDDVARRLNIETVETPGHPV